MPETSTPHAIGRTVRVARVIAAPPQTLFALWTDAAEVKQWWGTTDKARLMACEIDANPGGTFLYALRGASADSHEVATGTVLEVARPFHLAMSWTCEARRVKDSRVTVEFVDLRDGSARVSVVHERLPSPSEAAIHQSLWSNVLQDLAVSVSASADA
ncbi:MAG: SRPBCC domain-containing protein [Rhodospirillales bacterium]|jgi:uncharacterized protein YndB with AHSA1/START domain|nr:SRPBCC domain-containing protein [Rhodospirillales bacterium]